VDDGNGEIYPGYLSIGLLNHLGLGNPSSFAIIHIAYNSDNMIFQSKQFKIWRERKGQCGWFQFEPDPLLVLTNHS
jgi:hypothetical protein